MTNIFCPECGNGHFEDEDIETEVRNTGYGYGITEHTVECPNCGCVFYATEEVTFSYCVDQHGTAYEEEKFLEELGQKAE